MGSIDAKKNLLLHPVVADKLGVFQLFSLTGQVSIADFRICVGVAKPAMLRDTMSFKPAVYIHNGDAVRFSL